MKARTHFLAISRSLILPVLFLIMLGGLSPLHSQEESLPYSSDKLIADLKDKDLSDKNKLRRIEYARRKFSSNDIEKSDLLDLVDTLAEKNQSDEVRSKIVEFIEEFSQYCKLKQGEFEKMLDKLEDSTEDTLLFNAIIAIMNPDFPMNQDLLNKYEKKVLQITTKFKDKPKEMAGVCNIFSAMFASNEIDYFELEKRWLRYFVVEKKISSLIPYIDPSSLCINSSGDNFLNDEAIAYLSKLLADPQNKPLILCLLKNQFYLVYITQSDFDVIVGYYCGKDKELAAAAEFALQKITSSNEDILLSLQRERNDYSLCKILEEILMTASKNMNKRQDLIIPISIMGNNIYRGDDEALKYVEMFYSLQKNPQVSQDMKSRLLLNVILWGFSRNQNHTEAFVEWLLSENPSGLFDKTPHIWRYEIFLGFKQKLSESSSLKLHHRIVTALKTKIEAEHDTRSMLVLAEFNTLPKFTAHACLQALKRQKNKEQTRNRLVVTLQHILGKDFGDDYEAWQKAVDAMPDDKTLEEEEK